MIPVLRTDDVADVQDIILIPVVWPDDVADVQDNFLIPVVWPAVVADVQDKVSVLLPQQVGQGQPVYTLMHLLKDIKQRFTGV